MDEWNFSREKKTINKKIEQTELELMFLNAMKESRVFIERHLSDPDKIDYEAAIRISELYGVPFEDRMTEDNEMRRYFPKKYFEQYGEISDHLVYVLEHQLGWNSYRSAPSGVGWQDSAYSGGC